MRPRCFFPGFGSPKMGWFLKSKKPGQTQGKEPTQLVISCGESTGKMTDALEPSTVLNVEKRERSG